VNENELAAGLAPTPGYRYAEQVGDELFVAGQVPLDSAGNVLGVADPAVQARACLDNLLTLLRAHGFAVGDIRRLVVYVTGEHENLLNAWQAVTLWFTNEVPPATLLGVTCLGYAEQLVEIDATVVRRAAAVEP
jgi:enamine deaminase RidA (YjgF/YER057c/UK114 family)